jgi:long-subunit fatty acid transport protein
MQKIYILPFLLLAAAANVKAQVPEDALRLAWNPVSGTARNMSIGGAMTGLGGEMTAAHSNPAGLALYKTSEFIFSPGFTFNSNKTNYRGTDGGAGKQASGFNLGASGVILAGGFERGKLRSAALSLTVNKLADFNNYVSYKGLNNNSSGAEKYAEELSSSRLSLDDALDSRFVSLATRMAIFTYLIDTMTISGVNQIVAMPEFTSAVNQENTISTKGGIHEYAVSAAINTKDKFFFGASLGIPVVRYERDQTYKETDATSVLNNRFGSFTYTEDLSTRGVGFNLKLGVMYRPAEKVRLGLSIHSPSFYNLTDKTSASLNANTENYNGNVTVNQSTFANGASEIETKYSYTSPWKVAAGFSYVFREVENVKKQRAFIAADIEYITYKSMKFSSQEENPNQAETNYYNALSNNIKNIYRNTFNFKLGGEIKLNTIMLRAGVAYMGNPNKDKDVLNSNRLLLSGGLGYRNKGFFIDATYVHSTLKDINFPYRLDQKANTFAGIKGTGGTVMFTAGFKF